MAEKITRREVIKRAAYITPAILTLTAVPAFAKGGSGYGNDSGTYEGQTYRSSHQNRNWLESFFQWLQSVCNN